MGTSGVAARNESVREMIVRQVEVQEHEIVIPVLLCVKSKA